MTTFGAVLIYASTQEHALSFVPWDLRKKVSGGIFQGHKYHYTLRSTAPSMWELRIGLASCERLTEDDVWALDSHQCLSGEATFKPIEASDAQLQDLINQVTERGLHWAVALY